MTRNHSNDGTRRLRAAPLAKYAREVDAAVRNGCPGNVPEIRVSVGYEDEHHGAHDSPAPPRSGLTPATRREGLSLHSVPVLVAPQEDIAWFGLDADVERLCAAIDGRATIADILRTMNLGSEKLLSLLEELQEAGLVVIDLNAVR
jgi:hypothetical protein